MLMGLGPFRFTVPTFSIEQIDRQSEARIANAEVIGSKPLTHVLGPGVGKITLQSTFHPLHLNRAGGAMLSAVHLACDAQTPLMMISFAGRVFGRYIIESVGESNTMMAPGGRAQIVTASISLQQYIGGFGGGSIRVGLF